MESERVRVTPFDLVPGSRPRTARGVDDAWIAATALAHDLAVVTQHHGFDAAADLDVRVVRV